jgi:hypothetical protein
MSMAFGDDCLAEIKQTLLSQRRIHRTKVQQFSFVHDRVTNPMRNCTS